MRRTRLRVRRLVRSSAAPGCLKRVGEATKRRGDSSPPDSVAPPTLTQQASRGRSKERRLRWPIASPRTSSLSRSFGLSLPPTRPSLVAPASTSSFARHTLLPLAFSPAPPTPSPRPLSSPFSLVSLLSRLPSLSSPFSLVSLSHLSLLCLSARVPRKTLSPLHSPVFVFRPHGRLRLRPRQRSLCPRSEGEEDVGGGSRAAIDWRTASSGDRWAAVTGADTPFVRLPPTTLPPRPDLPLFPNSSSPRRIYLMTPEEGSLPSRHPLFSTTMHLPRPRSSSRLLKRGVSAD